MHTTACLFNIRIRVRARIGFGVWFVSGYVLLSVVIVTVP